jgi:hypothetical protein
MNNFKIIAASAFLALVGFQANAASVTTCGNDVCFTYDDSTEFGSANVVGNSIFFAPTSFTAESLNGQGAVSTSSTINVLVESITQGFNLQQFFLQEQGDYFIEGQQASVSAGGQFAATSLTKTCDTGGLFEFACREEVLLDGGDLDTVGEFDDWSISAFIDLAQNEDWGSDSRVLLTIENRLSATTFNLGEEAFIEKKFAGVGITVIPVPAAVWLLGSALGLLGFSRRKQVLAK